MSITVCKFGGSSVSDAGMFVRVNRILQSDPDRKYIVLSAPGKRCPSDEKITDLLIRAHGMGCTGDHSILARIFERYASIRDALAPDFDLEGEFTQIRANLSRSLDYVASRGEYLCAKLFAAYAHLPFVDAEQLLFFDEGGEIDKAATACAVRERLLPLGRAVVPGFYGVTRDGCIRTFSRGGSDVSGALLAAALSAQLYENWTDVDGLFTADPNLVERPVRNLTVSLSQMERISAAGARLLHPDALRPLHGTHIDTLLKNTFAPGAPGTRVSEDCADGVRCVTGRRALYMLGDASASFSGANDVLLHALPLQGSVRVAAVSAFGLTPAHLRKVETTIKPIHIIHMQDHIQFIIPEREYDSVVRIVHRILMEQEGDSN